MKFTSSFRKICTLSNRIIVQQGGTSSGKTYSTLQLLYLLAVKHQGIIISVVSESLPHLKRGAMRDFFNILNEDNLYSMSNHNRSDNIYHIGKSKIEFFSADNKDKMRGSRRDILYINECNNVDYDSFVQLEVRTRKRVYLDFNPVCEFWAHTEVLSKDKESILVKTNYKDNEYLDAAIVRSIESKKHNEQWWRVYGLGEIGTLEGIIFANNWKITESFPKNCKFEALGLDWGYTNDPTAIVKIGVMDNELYVNELCYEKEMSNDAIYKRIKDVGEDHLEIYADSAEPKSIDYLRKRGLKIFAATKGKDSVVNGIELLKMQRMNVTKDSTNVIKELRNYSWKKMGEGYINTPIDDFNHAIDALRYVVTMKLQQRNKIRYSNFI